MLKGELETPPNQWDAGNGALMRMTPVALCTLGDHVLLQHCSTEQGHLTHNHPLSDAACISYGRMIQMALMGAEKSRLRREADRLVADYPVFRFSRGTSKIPFYVCIEKPKFRMRNRKGGYMHTNNTTMVRI